MLTVLTNLTAWRLHLSTYNSNDFDVCCIPQMARKSRATFNQLTTFLTNIDAQTWFYGTFPSIWHWYQNKSPTRILACQPRGAICYFNGGSPTESAVPASVWMTLLQNSDVTLLLAWESSSTNSLFDGDSRDHDAHMTSPCSTPSPTTITTVTAINKKILILFCHHYQFDYF